MQRPADMQFLRFLLQACSQWMPRMSVSLNFYEQPGLKLSGRSVLKAGSLTSALLIARLALAGRAALYRRARTQNQHGLVRQLTSIALRNDDVSLRLLTRTGHPHDLLRGLDHGEQPVHARMHA